MRDLIGYESLVSITGIGPLFAAIFLAEISDVNDFATANKPTAYFGIAPRLKHSNDTEI